MSCAENVVPIITNVFSLACNKQGELLSKEHWSNLPGLEDVSPKPPVRILPKSLLVTDVTEKTTEAPPVRNPQCYTSTVDDPFRGIPEKIINDLADSVGNEYKQLNSSQLEGESLPAVKPLQVPNSLSLPPIPKPIRVSTSRTMGSNSTTVVSHFSQKQTSNLKNDSTRSCLCGINTFSKPITTIVTHATSTYSKSITSMIPLDIATYSKPITTIVPLGLMLSDVSSSDKPIPSNLSNINNKIPISNPNAKRTRHSMRTPTSLVRILPKTILKGALSLKTVPLPVDNLVPPTDNHPLSALHRTVGNIPGVLNSEQCNNNNVASKDNSSHSTNVTKHSCNVTIKVESDEEKCEPGTLGNLETLSSQNISTENIEEDEAKTIAESLFISPVDTSSDSNELSQSCSIDNIQDAIHLFDGFQCNIADTIVPALSDVDTVVSNDEIIDVNSSKEGTAIKEKRNKSKKETDEDSDVESSSDDDGAYEASDDSEYHPDEEGSSTESSGSDGNVTPAKKCVQNVKQVSANEDISNRIIAIQNKNVPILPATMLNNVISPNVKRSVKNTTENSVAHLHAGTFSEDVISKPNISNPILQAAQKIKSQSIKMVVPSAQIVIPTAQMVIPTAQMVTTSNKKDVSKTSVCLNQVLDILNMKKNQIQTSINTITKQQSTHQQIQKPALPLHTQLSRTLENIALLKQSKEQHASAIEKARSKLIKNAQNINNANVDENISTNIKCEKCNKHMFSLVELVSHKCVIENEIQRAINKSVLENAALQKMAEIVINKENSLALSIDVHQPSTISQSTISGLPIISSTVAVFKPVNVCLPQTTATVTPPPISLLSTKATTVATSIPFSTQTVPMYLVAQQTGSGMIFSIVFYYIQFFVMVKYY